MPTYSENCRDLREARDELLAWAASRGWRVLESDPFGVLEAIDDIQMLANFDGWEIAHGRAPRKVEAVRAARAKIEDAAGDDLERIADLAMALGAASFGIGEQQGTVAFMENLGIEVAL